MGYEGVIFHTIAIFTLAVLLAIAFAAPGRKTLAALAAITAAGSVVWALTEVPGDAWYIPNIALLLTGAWCGIGLRAISLALRKRGIPVYRTFLVGIVCYAVLYVVFFEVKPIWDKRPASQACADAVYPVELAGRTYRLQPSSGMGFEAVLPPDKDAPGWLELYNFSLPRDLRRLCRETGGGMTTKSATQIYMFLDTFRVFPDEKQRFCSRPRQQKWAQALCENGRSVGWPVRVKIWAPDSRAFDRVPKGPRTPYARECQYGVCKGVFDLPGGAAVLFEVPAEAGEEAASQEAYAATLELLKQIGSGI